MIKLTEAESVISRETPDVVQGRPVCVELLKSGIKVWLKGRHEFFVLDYRLLYREALRYDARVSIPPRNVSDAKLEKAKAAIEANRPE